MGFHMEVLDIGGGFTGHFDERGHVIFGEIASTTLSRVTIPILYYMVQDWKERHEKKNSSSAS